LETLQKRGGKEEGGFHPEKGKHDVCFFLDEKRQRIPEEKDLETVKRERTVDKTATGVFQEEEMPKAAEAGVRKERDVFLSVS